jgi:hypothetical protein
MMMNRLLGRLGPEEPPEGPEYYTVRGGFGCILVPRAAALALMRQLRRWIHPRWVRVIDMSGAEIWLPSNTIRLVAESTAAQREYDRKLTRLLDEEDKDWS